MTNHRVIVTFVLLAMFLCPGSTEAALSRAALGARNFNLYAQPSPANEMTLQDLQGRPVSLSALRGKVVLLNFWKIDCPPCSLEKPILQRIHRRFASRGLAIVAVNLIDDYTRIRQYANRKRFTFTIASDPKSRFSIRRHTLGSGMPTTFVVNSRSEAIYEIPAVPTTYVINRNGKVVGHATGMINWESPPFSEFLASLLERPSTMVARKPRAAPVAYESRRPPESTAFQGNPGPTEKPEPKPIARKPITEAAPKARVTKRTPDPSAASSSSKKQVANRKPTSPERSTPQRVRSSLPSSVKPRTPQPVSRRPATPATRPPAVAAAPPAYSAPARSSSLPPAARTTFGSRSLPAPPAAPAVPVSAGYRTSAYRPVKKPSVLPRAIPYTPVRRPTRASSSNQRARSQRPRPIVPDKNGYAMARMPSASTNQPATRNIARRNLPTAGPVSERNPFESFILESFEGGGSVGRPRPFRSLPTTSPQAGASILGRITSGISSTFWGFFPRN